MEKHKIGLTIASLFLSLAMLAGCTGNYPHWNTDPDKPGDPDLEKDFLNSGRPFIKQMQINTIILDAGSNAYQRSQNLMGDSYAGYVGSTGVFGANNSNGTTYFLLNDWNEVLFKHFFRDVMSGWKQIRDIVEESEDYMTFALAQILKVQAGHRTTDMYGPLPYFKYGESVQTPYDSQKDIYYSFFEDLDAAIKVLVEYIDENPGETPLAKFDLVYSGDLTKWVVFANSLRLRLALRIADVDPVKGRAEAEAALNHPYGIMTSNEDNALLNPAAAQFSHPIVRIYDGYNDTRMGAMLESYLTGYDDPRLAAYFQPATYTGSGARKYMGVRNGIDMNSTLRGSYMTFSKPNIDGSDKVMWMCAAEMYFIRAEAFVKYGWPTAADMSEAIELYYDGIRVSMDQHGCRGVETYLEGTSGPADYIDPVNSANNAVSSNDYMKGVPGVFIGAEDMGDTEKILERIGIQKWIALFPEGMEAWSSFRRSGYPRFFPVVINNSQNEIDTKIQVRRIKYPLDEHSRNSDNVKAAINNPNMLAGPDTGGTRLWWDIEN